MPEKKPPLREHFSWNDEDAEGIIFHSDETKKKKEETPPPKKDKK